MDILLKDENAPTVTTPTCDGRSPKDENAPNSRANNLYQSMSRQQGLCEDLPRVGPPNSQPSQHASGPLPMFPPAKRLGLLSWRPKDLA